MEVVGAHKGITSHLVTVTGHEAHSSLTHLGISATWSRVRLMAMLADIARDLEAQGDHASPFHPPHATLTIGQINGGTAVNILARECRFAFDLRCPAGDRSAGDPGAARRRGRAARCGDEGNASPRPASRSSGVR